MRYLFNEEYLEALRRCEPAAEEFLFSSFSRPLKSTLQKRFRLTGIVDDAAQETFLRVLLYFRSGKTLRRPASLPRFITAVATYVAMEMLREKGHLSTLSERLREPVDELENPERRAVSSEQHELVRLALARVDGNDARLLRRLFFEEVDKDQICSELQISREYLRVMLHRAKMRFRNAVETLDRGPICWPQTAVKHWSKGHGSNTCPLPSAIS